MSCYRLTHVSWSKNTGGGGGGEENQLTAMLLIPAAFLLVLSLRAVNAGDQPRRESAAPRPLRYDSR